MATYFLRHDKNSYFSVLEKKKRHREVKKNFRNDLRVEPRHSDYVCSLKEVTFELDLEKQVEFSLIFLVCVYVCVCMYVCTGRSWGLVAGVFLSFSPLLFFEIRSLSDRETDN